MADEATKRCKKCRRDLPLDDFHWACRDKGYRRPDCKDCRNKVVRSWFRANRDWKLTQNMRWYYENREAHIKRVMDRRDPVQHRAYQAKRRSNGLYRNGSKLSVKYRQILAAYGMVCWICAKEIASLDDLEFDHMIPLARGGEHVVDNILPSHRRCNRSKGSNY